MIGNTIVLKWKQMRFHPLIQYKFQHIDYVKRLWNIWEVFLLKSWRNKSNEYNMNLVKIDYALYVETDIRLKITFEAPLHFKLCTTLWCGDTLKNMLLLLIPEMWEQIKNELTTVYF